MSPVATEPARPSDAAPARHRARPSFNAAIGAGAKRVRRPRVGAGNVSGGPSFSAGAHSVLVGRACRRSDRAEVLIIESPRTLGSVVL